MDVGEKMLWLTVGSGVVALVVGVAESSESGLTVAGIAAGVAALVWLRRRNRTTP